MTYTHHIEVCLREPILTPTPVTTRSSYSTSNEQPTLLCQPAGKHLLPPVNYCAAGGYNWMQLAPGPVK